MTENADSFSECVRTRLKMDCPVCDSEKTKSLGLVRTPDGIMELRQCKECGEKFIVQ